MIIEVGELVAANFGQCRFQLFDRVKVVVVEFAIGLYRIRAAMITLHYEHLADPGSRFSLLGFELVGLRRQRARGLG